MPLLGKTPKKPAREEILPEAYEIHYYKKVNKVITREHIMKLHEVPHKNTWRNRRWLTLLAVNLLFVVSYYLDIQLLEGALTASRFMGFHMADLNSALQVMLAFKEVLINLVIGTT
ncbi:MAG: NapH/MauN family ferredoxin-type protein, partial [Thiogranum sp.]